MNKRKAKAVREAVSLYDAKTHLSSLVDRAHAGDEFVIMKSGRPLARLMPLDTARAPRTAGLGQGAWHVAADFDDALPETVLADFEGGS